MRFLAIDFETATASRDSACAVGVALVDGGRIVSSTSYFIQPPGNRYDSFNIGIHGIMPAMTANVAPFLPVMETVLGWADGLPLVAHNASFDMSVLRSGFDLHGREYPQRDYYCTLLMSRSAIPGLPDYKLPHVLAACGGSLQDHHDPKADAEACAEIALAIARNNGASTLKDLSKAVGMKVGHLYDCGYRPCRCSSSAPAPNATVKSMSEYVCNIDADPSGAFYDADVAFTGTMAAMPRDTAMQMVADRGGRPRTSVSKLTEYVVVGQLDYAAFTQGHPSSKLRKALELVESGYPLQVLTEKEFLELL
ncbi:MAG: hypothetical protein JXE06_01110 [Coriobacteriia bacterium]|nr:hypothetical protein [Coriobacteriia bacterium]